MPLSRRAVMIGGGAALLAGVGALNWQRGLGLRGARNQALRWPRADRIDDNLFARYASLAANGHNTQPWIFQIEQGQMRILPDETRRKALN